MTRSIYLSCARRLAISDRVDTVCMNAGGMDVEERAEEMRVDRRVAVWMDSLPPLRIAAFPDRLVGDQER